ncbi:bifunctional phosphoribosylaminoimidazolecarboxamide formyltransferase/IMP cyclohydrolase [Buchnera aphidicola (Takecallis taiwana)]|uniref:bifunctional phosphoribosylaminoimidazolecarboxamide formyltransferase/IMP cyclohydrolase n=1 Tax=Buchnera aphidicola TaxID=9 RepID=UPI0031B6F94F
MYYKNQKIKTALISVYNKKNIISLVKELFKKNITLFTTNSTGKYLKKNNIITKDVSEITKYPEIFDGQIKTLHPKIFGGILGKHNKNIETTKKYNIPIIDLVIVNFYPCHTLYNIKDYVKPNIDIGGPAMVRAAAKNYKNTIVIVDILDYQIFLNEIQNTGIISIETRLRLAKKAFEYTAHYDQLILQYLQNKINISENKKNNLPETIYIKYHKKQNLKYGENPHQKSALYVQNTECNTDYIESMQQMNGAKLSYNNIYDAHIAFECVNQFTNPTCVIIKHGNPCGASSATDLISAYLHAYNSDSISAFGGIIGFNQLIDKKLISTIIKKQFVELIIGPEITKDAMNIIKQNNKIKILIFNNYKKKHSATIEYKTINNSLLVQEINNQFEDYKKWRIVSIKQPTVLEKKYALFGWKITKFVKSNAIVYINGFNTISIGAGQTNRVEAVKIANSKYFQNKKQLKLKNPKIIMVSDAFFPFRDSIDICKEKNHDISCIIQPGGSIRDAEVIQAANENNICMIFTDHRIFKH